MECADSRLMERLMKQDGGTRQTSGTTTHFVRLAAKFALPPKYRRDRQ
jgi:hypothetical protein